MPFVSISKNKQHSVDEENPYWISFSDIMTGLLIIFILATLQLMLELSETKKEVDDAITELLKINAIRKEMLDEIKVDLSKNNIAVEVVENSTVVRIPDEQLYFRQSRYEIPDDKKYVVNEIGKVLFNALKKNDRYKLVDTIFIEGHTDSVPAPRLPRGNWGLSADRAVAVWKYWRENEQYGEEIQNLGEEKELGKVKRKQLFSVSGYAETRRIIIDDDTPARQKINRRIDIRFAMNPPRLTDLKSIHKKLDDGS